MMIQYVLKLAMSEPMIWFAIGLGASVWSLVCVLFGMSLHKTMTEKGDSYE